MPPNPANTIDLLFFTLPNAANLIKRAGVVVRDEEVVGSNPATPTAVSAVQSTCRCSKIDCAAARTAGDL
ncbi:MAG: hypothetical protein ACRDTS_18160, partial [Mycobacterium sp.]